MSWRVPSYLVPIKEIETDRVKITASAPVILLDDWSRQNPSGSVDVDKISYHEYVNSWSFFHSIVTMSLLPVLSVGSHGISTKAFSITDATDETDRTVGKREIFFDPDDMVPALFLESENGPVISYGDLFERYMQKDKKYESAVNSYFLAQDINFHQRMRSIDTSYWQVVFFVSAMESLLPESVYCKGRCETCGKGLKHSINDINKEWDDLVFNKIKNRKIRNNYRLILDVARWRIRNDTLHNGLMPNVQHVVTGLANGVTLFTTQKTVDDYLKDTYSLETLIDQLKQICRNVLLNQLFDEPFYPDLIGSEIHSQTIANITESNVTLELNF